MPLKDEWTRAKKAFDTALKNTPPSDSIKKLGKGADFSPALEKFDKASTFEARMSAVPNVLKAKTAYEALLDKAAKDASGAQTKAVTDMRKALLDVWKQVQDLAQPPRPSGSSVKYEVLRSFNLASGVKVKHLDVKATQVTAYVEIDSTLDQLIKDGKESLRVDHLGNVAKTEVDKLRNSFTTTIAAIETKIETVLLDPAKRDAKIKEANEVLKHYAKIVEDRINAAVQAEWQKYLSRKQYLKDFRIKSTVKIVLGAIGVGVAVASAALTFGALWMNVLAAAKGVLDLANNIKTLAEGMDTTYGKLLVDVDNVSKLNRQREEAKAKGEGQKASKTAEALKELANQLAPFTKALTTSANTAGERAKQFLGQTSQLESKADDLVGLLNKATANMSKLPEKDMTPELKKLAAAMDAKFQKTFAEITELHQQAQRAGAFGDRALKAVQKLKSEDSWGLDPSEIAGKYGARGLAIYGAANFIFQCAKHGKSLIPM
jgi:hypothetical protein